MSNLTFLRVMVLKELRTTFRERAQMRGLLMSLVILIVVFAATAAQMHRVSSHRPPSATATAGAPTEPAAPWTDRPLADEEMRLARWVAIGGVAVLGFFFSMGYLIAAVLSSFVGEKEARTLEILLASPVSDRRLYRVKCLSALLPSVGIGVGLALVAAILALTVLPVHLPPSLLFYGLVLGPPVMILPMTWFVGLGAAISARAETMKGAAQALGVLIMVTIFGAAYGLPLLLTTFPSLRAPAWSFIQHWLSLPFPLQYGMVVVILGGIGAACLAFGRVSFRRDRMLT